MGGLFLILPVVAFDFWLACTTGKRQFVLWRAQGNWRRFGLVLALGLMLGVWLAFFAKYSNGTAISVRGFPIPLEFFRLRDKTWTTETPPAPLPALGAAANFLTGLIAPLIPCKIGEFFKAVRAELK